MVGSTPRDADMILVLERGRIVEQGDHASLLARGGYLADLLEGGSRSPSLKPREAAPPLTVAFSA